MIYKLIICFGFVCAINYRQFEDMQFSDLNPVLCGKIEKCPLEFFFGKINEKMRIKLTDSNGTTG